MKISKSLAAVLALGLASAASAQPAGGPSDPWGDATATKEDAQAKAGAMFDRLDTDHDGSLSAAEEQAASQSAGPGMGRMVGGMMRRADSNGDGKLAKAEFLYAQQERFDRQDADHDGKLTKAERDAARAAMMQRMQRRGGGGSGSSSGEGGFGPPSGSDGDGQ